MNSAALPFDAKDTGYGISGLHKAACFAAIYKTFPNSISSNVKPHQKVMHTALKEVNGNKRRYFRLLLGERPIT